MPPAPQVTPPRCANCDAELTGAFCAACGQPVVRGRLRTREILGEVASNLFGLESKLWRTVLGLTRNPGRVAAEYVAGKRARYVPPFRYCVTALALFVVVTAAAGRDPLATIGFNVHATTSSTEDPGEPRDADAAEAIEQAAPRELDAPADVEPAAAAPTSEEVMSDVLGFLTRHLTAFLLLSLPFLGVTLRLLFRRAGRNYAETMAFVFYAVGHAYLLYTVLSLALLPWESLARTARSVCILGCIGYGSAVFFGGSRLLAPLKAFLAYAAYIVATILLAALLALPYVLWKL